MGENRVTPNRAAVLLDSASHPKVTAIHESNFDKTAPCTTPTALAPDTRAWAEVDLGAIRANVAALRAALGAEIRLMAVVKGDGYGHGLIPTAKVALEAGAAWLGIAAVAEGIALRQAGVSAPILLLCPCAPEEAEAVVAHRLTAAVGDHAILEALAKAAGASRKRGNLPEIHLDVDTGMGRSGIAPEAAAGLWNAAQAAGLPVTGLMTHFADADGPDEVFTLRQAETFERVRKTLTQLGARFDHVHLCNSAATLRFPALRGNLVRPGLLLYGIRPPLPKKVVKATDEITLCPALTLKARVATVRTLTAGHNISYGATHRLRRESRVATVLIGYGDGYPRRLSNTGEMLLHGRRAPILGRVCMDQTVVDVTELPDVSPGDVAVCIGTQGSERISVEEIAARVDTTAHEITTDLTPRVPRRYINPNGQF